MNRPRDRASASGLLPRMEARPLAAASESGGGGALLPCPFCGAGTTEIRPNGRVWTGMSWGEPSSVSVRHWCPAIPGQPSRLLERVGRDDASAIAAWNTRSAAASPDGTAK